MTAQRFTATKTYCASPVLKGSDFKDKEIKIDLEV